MMASPAHAGSYKVLHSFGGSGDGDYPIAGLIKVGDTLYGTTQGVYNGDVGTVFSLNLKTGKETVLYQFQGGSDGAYPHANLISVGSKLYGTTIYGGIYTNCGGSGCGTIFSVDRVTGAETVLHRFKNGADGAGPLSSLINVSGILFGTTTGGGGRGDGTIFSLNLTSNKEKVVYRFTGYPDGETPWAGLIEVGGLLYGTAELGGDQNNPIGTVFSFDPKSEAFKVVHAFQGYPDAGCPTTNLLDFGGTLFGTANCVEDGAVFSVNPKTMAEKVLYSFQGGNDGEQPDGSVIKVGRLLYGTTLEGGGITEVCGTGCGTVFSLDPKTGTETVLHSFGTGVDGIGPYSGLLDVSGKLYGTTNRGGIYNEGTIFEITP
jgi:uncharacterized repeat protein (TIGR03803 family)